VRRNIPQVILKNIPIERLKNKKGKIKVEEKKNLERNVEVVACQI